MPKRSSGALRGLGAGDCKHRPCMELCPLVRPGPNGGASEEWAMAAEPRQQAAPHAWHAIFERTLKANDVKLVTYLPDRVLTPLIACIDGDAFFYGVRHRPRGGGGRHVAGAWMGRHARRGAHADERILPRLPTSWHRWRCASQPNAERHGQRHLPDHLRTAADGCGEIRLVAIAQGCGLAARAWAADEEDFRQRSAAAPAADKPPAIPPKSASG